MSKRKRSRKELASVLSHFVGHVVLVFALLQMLRWEFFSQASNCMCTRCLRNNPSQPPPLSHCLGRKVRGICLWRPLFREKCVDWWTVRTCAALSHVIVSIDRAWLPEHVQCLVSNLTDRWGAVISFSVQYVIYCPWLPLVILFLHKYCICTFTSNVLLILGGEPSLLIF